jgi:mannosyltransferase
MALATALVVRHLGTKPIWLDEAVSLSVARRPLGRLLIVLTHHDANAGLYDLLLHGWLYLGRGAAWDRGVSAICFVATGGLVAWVGTRWRGAGFGVACGVLVATNPFLLFYGQEARSFALAVLLAVGSTAALFWRDGEPAPGPYVAATIALLYADLFAVLFVAAQAAMVVVVHRRRDEPVPPVLLRSWRTVALGAAPLAVLMIVRERSQISWLGHPSVHDLVRTFTSMTSGWLGLGVTLGLVGLAAVAVVAGGGARDGLVVAALVGSFVVPPVILWSVAQVVPVFLDRYVICSAVAAIGLAAMGLDVVRRRAGTVAALAGLALLVGLGGQRVAALERAPIKYENPPAVVAFVGRSSRPGDAIGYSGGGLRTVLDGYRRQGSSPFDVALAPGGDAWRQHDLYAREVSPAVLEQRLADVQRLWLVTDPTDRRYPSYGPFNAIRSDVMNEFEPVAAASLPGVDVTLYVRRSALLSR